MTSWLNDTLLRQLEHRRRGSRNIEFKAATRREDDARDEPAPHRHPRRARVPRLRDARRTRRRRGDREADEVMKQGGAAGCRARAQLAALASGQQHAVPRSATAISGAAAPVDLRAAGAANRAAGRSGPADVAFRSRYPRRAHATPVSRQRGPLPRRPLGRHRGLTIRLSPTSLRSGAGRALRAHPLLRSAFIVPAAGASRLDRPGQRGPDSRQYLNVLEAVIRSTARRTSLCAQLAGHHAAMAGVQPARRPPSTVERWPRWTASTLLHPEPRASVARPRRRRPSRAVGAASRRGAAPTPARTISRAGRATCGAPHRPVAHVPGRARRRDHGMAAPYGGNLSVLKPLRAAPKRCPPTPRATSTLSMSRQMQPNRFRHHDAGRNVLKATNFVSAYAVSRTRFRT